MTDDAYESRHKPGHVCCGLERQKKKIYRWVWCSLAQQPHKDNRQGCAGPHSYMYYYEPGSDNS